MIEKQLEEELRYCEDALRYCQGRVRELEDKRARLERQLKEIRDAREWRRDD